VRLTDETTWALKEAGLAVTTDHKFMLPLLKQDPDLLCLCDDAVLNDRTLVMKAVQQDGSMLKYASEDLRNDLGVVLAALKESALRAYDYVPEELRLNHQVALLAHKQGLPLPKPLLTNRKAVLAAVQSQFSLSFGAKRALQKLPLQTIIAEYELA